jgi:urease gamma subunit
MVQHIAQKEFVKKKQGLKLNFRKEVAPISAAMLKRVVQNFQKSLRENFEKRRHLTDTIFRNRIL